MESFRCITCEKVIPVKEPGEDDIIVCPDCRERMRVSLGLFADDEQLEPKRIKPNPTRSTIRKSECPTCGTRVEMGELNIGDDVSCENCGEIATVKFIVIHDR